jgi:hypothetical protein
LELVGITVVGIKSESISVHGRAFQHTGEPPHPGFSRTNHQNEKDKKKTLE